MRLGLSIWIFDMGITEWWDYLKTSFCKAVAQLEDINDIVDPRITNTYAPYKLQTPSKAQEFAYVFLEQA
jgi:hypothetical protein